MHKKFSPFCLSSYLAFRYVVEEGKAWTDGVAPTLPAITNADRKAVTTAEDVEAFLESIEVGPDTGILLSGGIDSAILASYLPKGSPAYSIDFMAEGVTGESGRARRYAEAYDLDFHVVQVQWEDYLACMDELMLAKKAPLHAVEPALYLAAAQASRDGVRTLMVGNGADSTFGGMDKLLSRDWTPEEFMARYTFVEPAAALAEPVSMEPCYAPYATGELFDVSGFLKVVHGLGIIQSFEHAIHHAGVGIAAPYEDLVLDAPLDMERIRNGEPKYLLQHIFKRRYPQLKAPWKIPFARPMDHWLADWTGPKREEFLPGLDMNDFSGDQRWLLFCLERFLNALD